MHVQLSRERAGATVAGAQQAGSASLAGGPAPVQSRVIACPPLERRVRVPEALKGDEETAPLGLLGRGASVVKARAVYFRSRDALGEGGADGPAAAPDRPVHGIELGPHRVDDLPDRVGARQEALELIARGDGEAGGERAVPAA